MAIKHISAATRGRVSVLSWKWKCTQFFRNDFIVRTEIKVHILSLQQNIGQILDFPIFCAHIVCVV